MKTVQDLFESFPDIVLLVGNGKMEAMGHLIDSYECVIRFNDFVIDGYEYDVGTKVSAISLHCSDFTFPHSNHLLTNYLKYREGCPIFTTSPRYGHSKSDIIHVPAGTKLLDVANPIFIDGTRLSSGASLALNLSLLFEKEVHLVGFDGFKTGHYFNPNHDTLEHAKLSGLTKSAHSGSYESKLLSKISTIKYL
jgi:hypothetical protein